MENHQVNIKYKLFSCIIALSLVFGISAMPAFATPDSSASEGGSAQVEGEQDAHSEGKTLTHANVQAASSDASESGWGADTKKEIEQRDTKQSELNGLEKLGVAVGAESELIGAQATDSEIAVQENDEQKDPKEMQKSLIRASIILSNFGSYEQPSTAPLTIKKMFPATDTSFLIPDTEEGGDEETAPYTVEFEVRGAYLDKDGCLIYKNGKNDWFCVNPKDVNTDDNNKTEVNDLKHRALYYENNGNEKLFSMDEKGIYDTDADSDPRKSLYLYPEGNVADQKVLIVDNGDNTYGYVYNDQAHKVFFMTKDENSYEYEENYGEQNKTRHFINVKKVRCEKSDSNEYLIGTVMNNDAGGADTEAEIQLKLPNGCGLVEGDNYIGILYKGVGDSTDFSVETDQFVVLKSKKLDLTRCTIGAMPKGGSLTRAEFNYSTISIPINKQSVSKELDDLPYPAEYTITEKSDPCYTFIKSVLDDEAKNLGNPATIKIMDGEGHTITFENKIDPNSDSPNLSIVNEYSYDYDNNEVIVHKKVAE